jgi:arylsulfatase A-like enzyme
MEHRNARRMSMGAVSLALSCLVVVSGCDDRVSKHEIGPNVVLVVVDTLRADYLGTYGFEAGTSPNLDALAEKSVVFDRAVAASTLTAPAHASIMTSRFVREHSIGYLNGGTRLVDLDTLASVFQDAGYETAAFISNSILKSRIGLDHGFDVYDDALPQAERNRPYVFERTAMKTTHRAIEWLEADRDVPYFLWVHYQDPHGPYTPPRALADELALPPTPGERPLPILNRQNGYRGIPAYQALPGLRFLHQYRSRYAAEIRFFDAGLGKLLGAVWQREGKAGTVVLLTADHAESMGEADYFLAHGHATTPDMARVPFLLSAPGLAPGRNAQLVHHVDVMPTLIDLAGLPQPADLRGLALGRVLRSQEDFPVRTVYSDVGNDVSAYERDGFVRISQKGAEANGSQGRWQAFDWSDDGTWSPTDFDEASRPAISAYLDGRTPTAEAAELEPADVERLRALGYVEPGE